MRRLLLTIIFLALGLQVKAQVGDLIWEEPFDSLRSDLWNIQIGDGCPELCYWGNGEHQYYQESNVFTDSIPGEAGNRGLVIEARREISPKRGFFTSGRINTEGKVEVKYGVIEVRMRVPDLETGLWPAAWLLGANNSEVGWPQSGEIDMMEMGHAEDDRAAQGHPDAGINSYVGANIIWYSPSACNDGNQTCAAQIAYDAQYNQPYVSSEPMSNRFVIYRLYWDDSQMRLTVTDNGREYDLYTSPLGINSGELSGTFKKPFFLLLNMAVGGNFTDAPTITGVTAEFPAKMYVDYIRVHEWNNMGEVTINGELVSNEKEYEVPDGFELSQNYPNPFNPSTIIRYQIPESNQVKLQVFDALGRQVAELVNEVKAAGNHTVQFNAGGLPSGMYYYKLETPAFSMTRKMMLIK